LFGVIYPGPAFSIMVAGVPFSDDEVFVLAVLERTGGSLSLFGVCLIFIAYALFER
jgi:hypothetical protein